MKHTKLAAVALSAAMVLSQAGGGSLASAEGFSDMPDDWSTTALQNAVDNGLLSGTDGMLLPKDNLTRAQMAAVISRALGATYEADLSGYSDVPEDAWFRTDMAKAVKMGIFQGSDGLLNPNNNITREEACAVLARAFKLTESTAGILDQFADSGEISSWASAEVAAMASNGYISGADGYINPKANITRAEFAKIMDNMVKAYGKDGAISDSIEGSVVVSTAGVTIDGATITGDLIVGDGVAGGDVTVSNTKINGRLVIRGGANVKLTGSNVSSGTVIDNIYEGTRLTASGGTISNLFVNSASVLTGAFGQITVASSASVDLTSGSANTITVSNNAANSKITVGSTATVTTIVVNGAGTTISGSGKVTGVNANANNVSVNTVGTSVTAAANATGVTANGIAVNAGSTNGGYPGYIGGNGSYGGGSSSGSNNEDDNADINYITISWGNAYSSNKITKGNFGDSLEYTLTLTATEYEAIMEGQEKPNFKVVKNSDKASYKTNPVYSDSNDIIPTKVEFIITAENDDKQTYTLFIETEIDSDASLTGTVVVSAGSSYKKELDVKDDFKVDGTEYSAVIELTQAQVASINGGSDILSAKATPLSSSSTVEYSTIPKEPTSNIPGKLLIEVTSKDEKTTNTYIITIKLPAAEYTISATPSTGSFQAGAEGDINIIMKGATGATAVDHALLKVNVENAPDGATASLMTEDADGVPVDLINAGEWGTSGGFAMDESYDQTLSVKATFDTAGEYKITLTLVNVDEPSSAPLATVTLVYTVTEATTE